MNKFSLIGLGGLLVAGLAASNTASAGSGTHPHDTATFAVYGDSPYGINPTDIAQVDSTPAFIASINADPAVQMVLHVGDIHSGKQYCTAAYDTAVRDLWQAFADPLVYTPGDNEWADCHKPGEGGGVFNSATGVIDRVVDSSGSSVDYAGGDPVANLDLIRSLFFTRPGVTLGRPAAVMSQARVFDRAHPTDAKFVENVMWERDDVMYVTANIPGGSNNDTDAWFKTPTTSVAQTQEVAERTGADLRWIDAAFALARREHAKAVVIMEQADMWDLDGKTASHLTAYEPVVHSIATHTAAFGRPVLLLNGDSHEYRSDNPLSLADPLNLLHPGYDVPNFHRVVVHGSTLPMEWLRLTVDSETTYPSTATSFGPFSWERMTQP
jgi:hypothetical protein